MSLAVILTGKQQRFLRLMGMELDPIVQIGKGGVNESVAAGAAQAIESRELIKVRVLANSPLSPKEAVTLLGEMMEAAVVQVIGRNGLLYRPNEDKPVIVLP